MIKKTALTIFLSALLLGNSVAIAASSDSFVLKKIHVTGLERIKLNTLYSYLPIRLGDTIDAATSNKIINELYNSGFFSNISLTHQGGTLNIAVAERPVVSDIHLKGNKAIKTDMLLKALKSSGIAVGLEYNPSTLDQIKNVLLQQYFTQSKFGVTVNVDVKKLPRDRVSVNIVVVEGKAATIKQIDVIGNHAFTEKALLNQFKLSTPTMFSFFSHNDYYSREKLSADLESMRDYYLNHGYLQYKLNSSQVSITPNLQGIYITTNIFEGPQYHVGTYSFSGKTILSQQELKDLIQFKTGDVFSRQAVVNTQQAISIALGNLGYANADISIQPKVNAASKLVAVNFVVKPGERTYIRHISFVGNFETDGKVFRRQLEQYEGSVYSASKIDESKRNLLILPFVANVDVSKTPVPGSGNQEDLNYKITEHPANAFNAGVGYGTAEGLLFTMSLNQTNFLGTGNSLNLNFSRNAYSTSYGVDYFNPFYTLSGIGREISFNYSKYNGSKADVVDYSTNELDAAINYSIPYSNFGSYTLGYGAQNTSLEIGSAPSQELLDFTKLFGSHFYQIQLNGGWSYNSFDRAIFPTAGAKQNLGVSVTVPLSKHSLRYYRTEYTLDYYKPLYKRSWLFNATSDFGFGNGYGSYAGNYPFFRNFYAGGMGSVRGYQDNSLGPHDTYGNPLGGNILITSSLGLVFPNPISSSVRTSLFADAGNVFNSNDAGSSLGLPGVSLNQLRYSTGVQVQWLSPMGVTLNFAFAKALHPGPADNTQFFEFSMSAGTS